MPKFYCIYCDTYLTHYSPSVRKTHCSRRKQKENVKDFYQKWMEEQAQSLIDKTTPAFQKGRILPNPFSAPPSGGPMIPSLYSSMRKPPPPGMMFMGPPPGKRMPMGVHIPMMPGPPMMRPLPHHMMVPT
ncbi:U1 small nuclear ribonucleoprotein C-like [Gracilinanus agilis]|uniref:U1 small nuclear ribonucleoprotein C-like n=1 Tax=Gracilinanus agilis TaxID=191870 RepID=UPI001CFDD11D|nr:U1 small nuclear ribonucleoprotein C-like [Gracilinanus agilis]